MNIEEEITKLQLGLHIYSDRLKTLKIRVEEMQKLNLEAQRKAFADLQLSCIFPIRNKVSEEHNMITPPRTKTIPIKISWREFAAIKRLLNHDELLCKSSQCFGMGVFRQIVKVFEQTKP